MNYYAINEDGEYLQHYGVKGMKWGVRRYRNYDGTYTQAGLKRFDKSLENYTNLKAKKKQYGSKTLMNSKTTYGRATKLAKKQLKKDYKHLKQDKLADQGKNLYANGYRITDNIGRTFKRAGTVGLGATASLYSYGIVNRNQAATIAAISAGTAAIGEGINLVNRNKNRKLRAYYAHTSRY